MAYIHNTADNSSMGIFLGLLVGVVIAVLLVAGVRSYAVFDDTAQAKEDCIYVNDTQDDGETLGGKEMESVFLFWHDQYGKIEIEKGLATQGTSYCKR